MSRVDLDAEIVERALKRASLSLLKTSGPPSTSLFMDLVAALRVEVDEAYKRERLAWAFEWQTQWTPKELHKLREKGPRPYHRSAEQSDMLRRAQEGAARIYTGFDYAKPGNIIADPPAPPEPCPHEKLDDEGAPPRRHGDDHDEFPKVGTTREQFLRVMGWKD